MRGHHQCALMSDPCDLSGDSGTNWKSSSERPETSAADAPCLTSLPQASASTTEDVRRPHRRLQLQKHHCWLHRLHWNSLHYHRSCSTCRRPQNVAIENWQASLLRLYSCSPSLSFLPLQMPATLQLQPPMFFLHSWLPHRKQQTPALLRMVHQVQEVASLSPCMSVPGAPVPWFLAVEPPPKQHQSLDVCRPSRRPGDIGHCVPA
mmetsp:Transcript_29530/g.68101  ORF Transcript_29530/g.68101 Transcript_29530/m.68101 type:complete len:206 (-) Transcript_29530:789-1406(-)